MVFYSCCQVDERHWGFIWWHLESTWNHHFDNRHFWHQCGIMLCPDYVTEIFVPWIHLSRIDTSVSLRESHPYWIPTFSLPAGDLKLGERLWSVKTGLKAGICESEQEPLRSETAAPPWLVHILAWTQVRDGESERTGTVALEEAVKSVFLVLCTVPATHMQEKMHITCQTITDV